MTVHDVSWDGLEVQDSDCQELLLNSDIDLDQLLSESECLLDDDEAMQMTHEATSDSTVSMETRSKPEEEVKSKKVTKKKKKMMMIKEKKSSARTLEEVVESLENTVATLSDGNNSSSSNKTNGSSSSANSSSTTSTQRKLREAREEERVRQLHRQRFQRLLDIHRKRVLLHTLQDLHHKLLSQSERLQHSYSSVLNMRKTDA
jgi:hypothetical protein